MSLPLEAPPSRLTVLGRLATNFLRISADCPRIDMTSIHLFCQGYRTVSPVGEAGGGGLVVPLGVDGLPEQPILVVERTKSSS